MLSKNIFSNKFDLKLVITFSSYWCTAIFTKSRSLHYVLKKQRKSTKSEWHRREKTTPSKSATLKKQKRPNINDAQHSKETRIHSQEMTRKEHQRFQNNETQTEKEHQ